ncbi:MAG: amidohydrolase family protein [Deltaproteobacteria bacterium]|nr:amidohydrolase family protein [Deltaproteobacteria bacterium]
MMFDLVVRNGLVCDGTGQPARLGSVAISGSRIAAIGPEVGVDVGAARRVIDAAGLVIAPGFIDPHTHFDAQLSWDGLATPSLEHGVTTVIPGNCSLSLAPLRAEHREFLGAAFRQIEELPKSAFDAGLRFTWQTFGEYREAIAPKLGLNNAPLVGHSLLRLYVLGLASRDRASTPEELRALADCLRQCLDEGALGLSTSFVDVDHEFRPVPCRLGTLGELDALCAVLGERGRPLQLVPEFWDADLLATRIDQLAELSLRHQIPITFSPLFESRAMPGLVARTLERLELQAARGARIQAQMQTRPVDMTFDLRGLNAVFSSMPTWMGILLSGQDATRRAFADPATRKKLAAETDTAPMPLALSFSLAETRLTGAKGADAADLGRTLGELARERGRHPAEVLMDVSLAEDLDARFTATDLAQADEPAIGPALRHPQVQIGAGDGGAHVARFATCGDTGHLFARYVRARRAMTLEEACKRVSADVADFWGIPDRGQLAKGQVADLVVFDAATIDRGPEELAFDLPDGGTSFRFVRRSIGIREVVVGGESVYRDGEGYTDVRRGEWIAGRGR